MHFLAIGALMFAVYEIRNGGVETVEPDVIIVGPEKIAQIEAGFTSVWSWPPDTSEMNKISPARPPGDRRRETLTLGLSKQPDREPGASAPGGASTARAATGTRTPSIPAKAAIPAKGTAQGGKVAGGR